MPTLLGATEQIGRAAEHHRTGWRSPPPRSAGLIRKVSGPDEFVELSEPLYALCFVWLCFSGPGRVASTTCSRRSSSVAAGGRRGKSGSDLSPLDPIPQ